MMCNCKNGNGTLCSAMRQRPQIAYLGMHSKHAYSELDHSLRFPLVIFPHYSYTQAELEFMYLVCFLLVLFISATLRNYALIKCIYNWQLQAISYPLHAAGSIRRTEVA